MKMYFNDLPLLPSEIILLMTSASQEKDLVILAENKENARKKFFKGFKLISAAGGLVRNQKDEFLFIFRNGKWDLPKGKIEKGEKPKLAAIREVQEETGINLHKIIRPIHETFHCYFINEQPVLKKTYWFEMVTTSTIKLNPQTEEGITNVEWKTKKQLNKCMKNSYRLIGALIHGYMLIASSK